MAESEHSLDAATQVTAFQHPRPCNEIQPALPSLAGYEVLREIGRGGTGLVYLARDLGLDRLVALKTFHLCREEGVTDLLRAEARTVGKLDHPSIVPVYEVNLDCQPAYFSMAYVEGEDLAQQISRQVLDPQAAAILGIKMAGALEHAHAAGVLHLDIKPANILLDRKDEPRITDFGLFAHQGACASGGIEGTPQFMAPEQALGQSERFSESTDIYSLGAVLFAALAGRPPLVSFSDQDLILKVASQRPQPLRAYGLRVPAPLDAIVMKCLEKEPNRRYDSAKALREDLQCFLDGKPIHARPPGVLENVHFWIRQHIFASRVSGSVVLVLLLSVAALIFNLSRERNALKKEVMEMEHLILSQASRVTSSLRVHTGEQQLKVTQDVSAQMASELYALGNLRLAARCAAEAIVAGAVLGEPAPEHLADMVHEYYRDQTVADDVSLLELAERLLDDSMAEQYALPHVPEDDSQVQTKDSPEPG